MSEWAPKRFWTDVSVVKEAAGFAVRLDDKPLNTPAKVRLVLPTQALADGVGAEWAAQTETIDPATMPLTRSANSAIDKVGPQRAAVVQMLAEYGGSDLLCYRADGPAGLVSRQAEAWDPWLAWSSAALDAPLVTTSGVMPITQPSASLARLHARIDDLTDFEIAGFHDLVALSGSLVLALAVQAQKLDPAEAWRLSRIDDTWQIEQWGEDEEATDLALKKERDFLAAAKFCALCVNG